MDVNFRIRNYESSDLHQIIEIVVEAGFPYYKYAIELLNRIDHHGLFVAENVNSGK